MTAALTAGTLIESYYDIDTGRYWVYHSFWFRGLLGLLGLNILVVALSRFPWRPRQIPFLMAHLGILMLLTGSLITDRRGIDGTLTLAATGSGRLRTSIV